VLLLIFHAAPQEFRTGWFIESLLTELVIALVVRTRRPFFRSRPGKWLLRSSLVMMVLALAMPYGPWAGVFGFVPLPLALMLGVIGLTLGYVGVVELAKKRFYARVDQHGQT